MVSKYTFKDIAQSKIFFNVFILGVSLIVMTFVAAELSYGVPTKIALDFGLGVSTLAVVGISIFMGVNLMSTEIESRTIYMVLSRPLNRSVFLTGKLFGMQLILFLNILILYLLTMFLYFYLGGEWNKLIGWTVVFSFMEANILLLIVILLSLLINRVLTVMNTLTIFVLGHAIGNVTELPYVMARPSLKKFIVAYSYIFPDFSKINIKNFIIYQKDIETDFLLPALTYSVFYSLIIYSLAILIFNRKNLD